MYNYLKKDIVQSLADVGLKLGDTIFCHSNLGFFGKLKGGDSRERVYQIFKESIFEVIGDRGTLVVPTFSYSFCNEQEFDIDNTPSVCGFFSEEVRKDSDSIRSLDANFSVSAIGDKANQLTENSSIYTFGEDSFWERFYKLKGKICNFNFDSGSTFVHFVERELKVPYRFDKKFSGIAKISGERKELYFYHFCYDLDKPWDAPEFSKLDKQAKNCDLAKTANLGKGQIVCISAEDTYSLIQNEIEKDPYFLRKGQ